MPRDIPVGNGALAAQFFGSAGYPFSAQLFYEFAARAMGWAGSTPRCARTSTKHARRREGNLQSAPAPGRNEE